MLVGKAYKVEGCLCFGPRYWSNSLHYRAFARKQKMFEQYQHKVASRIIHLIKSNFNGPYPSSKKMPKELRDMMFREFENIYCWLSKDAKDVCKIFKHHGSE
ncbi:hypothetical protein ACH5RR_041044 [Cinchona calisaya]|uniref:Uncharacterized protein n=1 Tax=Cinchona calisaya TaxID=153742 RepID=A0ABD2XSU9_9GENT